MAVEEFAGLASGVGVRRWPKSRVRAGTGGLRKGGRVNEDVVEEKSLSD
jgi:hypothetical protein